MNFKCQHCHSDYRAKPYRKSTTRFCSRRCLWVALKPSREPKRLAALRGRHPSNFKACYITCEKCGKSFNVPPAHATRPGKPKRYCSRECYFSSIRMTPRPQKYRRITRDGKRFLEHRWVMEQHLGRRLNTKEQVDHINRDRHDNRIENLRILDIRVHGALSSQQRFVPK